MGSIFGIRSGTEEVPYDVLESKDNFEVRQYGDRIILETLMPHSNDLSDSTGFRTLAAYIFGRNETKEKFAMTAPVEVRPNEQCAAEHQLSDALLKQGSGMIMRFTLPHDVKEESLPKPLDRNLNITKIGPETFATIRFSGLWTETSFEEHANVLLQLVDKSDYMAIGPAVSLRYDPPWTISCFRRNEVAIPVEKRAITSMSVM